MSWTDDQVVRLREHFAAGLSAGQIASRMRGVSRNAVIGKLYRLGLTQSDRPTTRNRKAIKNRLKAAKLKTAHPPSFKFGSPRRADKGPALVIEPLPVARETDIGRKTLLELDDGKRDCRWPVGEAPVKFCAAPAVEGLPYCASHAERAFAAPVVRVRRVYAVKPQQELRILEAAE